jgi:hypothetical protein
MRDLTAGSVSQTLQMVGNEAVSSTSDGTQLPVTVFSATEMGPTAAGWAINLAMCEIQG